MKKVGTYIQPYGRSLPIKTDFYGIRFTHKKAVNSQNVLGLQVLINFMGEPMWVNIRKEWIL